MLHSHDAAVVHADPGLPALGAMLDDAAALALFQQHYPQLQPTAARCTYLRYKPRASCLAAFTLDTPQGERILYAKAYSTEAHDKISKAAARSTCSLAGTPRHRVIGELSLLLLPFPLDDELPALQQLYASDGPSAFISRLAPDRKDLQAATVVPLRYKPERRFVARLDVAGKPTAVLKIHTKSHYAQARRAVKSFWQSDDFHTAYPLGNSDRHGSMLLKWLAGVPLSDSIRTSSDSCQAFENTGAALASLHATKAGKLPTRPPKLEQREIELLSNDFQYISATLAKRLIALTSRYAAKLADQSSPPVSTHGDFHPAQVLVLDNHVALLDLDNGALGSGAYDMGNFLAYLERAVLLGSLRENEKESLRHAFLTGYENQTHYIDEPVIQIQTVAGLLRLVYQPFRLRHSDWHDQTEAILTRAEQLLDEATTASISQASSAKPLRQTSRAASEVAVVDPYRVDDDDRLPQLASAINPASARLELLPIVREAYGEESLELGSIRVVRHKPRRRCLIAYEFLGRNGHGPITLLGKIHAKSRHEQSLRLQQLLWDGGFDAQSCDGVSVARPVDIVPKWQMWLQEHIPGQNAWEALSGPGGEKVATRIADAARKLHQTNIPTQRVHTIENELQILEEKLPEVSRHMPRVRSRIDAVFSACRDLAGTIPDVAPTGIHRDFYPDQVMVAGDRIYILDYDLYCLGNPSLDIGNFCAHLIEKGLRRPSSGEILLHRGRTLVERFARLFGDGYGQSVEAFTTLSLARHIYLSTRFEDRKSSTLAILSLCEQRLAAVS